MSNTPPAEPVPPVEPPVDPYAPATPPPPPAPSYAVPAYSPAGYAPGFYGSPPPPQGLAIASLATGIGGVLFSFLYGFGFLPSLAAVITGHLARKRQPHARGLWLAGLICGYVGLGISVLWFIVIVLFIVFVVANPHDSSNF